MIKTMVMNLDRSLIISMIALGISLYSAYLTRQNFIKSARPYISAASYYVLDAINSKIVSVPSRLIFRVTNSPAKINNMEVVISLDEEKLFTYEKKDFPQFPVEKPDEWSFAIGEDEFGKIMNRSDTNKSKLIRNLRLEYSSLDGGKNYIYTLIQHFEPLENNWKDVSVNSS